MSAQDVVPPSGIWESKTLLRAIEPAGIEPAGIEPAGETPRPIEPAGMEPAGIEPAGIEPAGIDPAGIEPAGIEPAGIEPAGIEPAGAERMSGVKTGSRAAGIEVYGAAAMPAGTEDWSLVRASTLTGLRVTLIVKSWRSTLAAVGDRVDPELVLARRPHPAARRWSGCSSCPPER